MPYALSCHCGAIKLEVDAELTGLVECNCSTCARHGILHWKVPVEAVRLVTQKVALTGYRDRISVNARCIEGIDVFTLKVERYDGRTLMPPGPTT